MKPDYELPNFGSSFQQAQTDRSERPGRPSRQIDGILSTRVLRRVNGLKLSVRRSVGRISRWRQRRTAIRQLQALSDHCLTDIGLDRSQIVSTVEETIKSDGQSA